jgi:hypothetical protein
MSYPFPDFKHIVRDIVISVILIFMFGVGVGMWIVHTFL